MKSLKDISWQVDEPTYREDKALSYSTLAKYERSGFNNLDKLFDKVESPSLTFGSAVDSIITGGYDEFDERFVVADFPAISDNLIKVAKYLHHLYENTHQEFTSIPDEVLSSAGKECGFYVADKYNSYRVKLIKENCQHYYDLLYLSDKKTIISSEDYQDVMNAVDALKDSKSTEFYFKSNNPFDKSIERLYQLKFKGTFFGVDYRCMADLIIVDYNNKTVQPIDLKTSSHTEWDFYKSFIDWNYQIQARLYWAIIRQNMDNDDFFKDFELLDYKFIVVNKKTLTPLVWDCPFTKEQGDLHFGKNNQIEMRHPFTIGEELYYYLNSAPKVPKDINIEEPNNLTTWLNKM